MATLKSVILPLVIVCGAGCSLSYPICKDKYAEYCGKTRIVENKAVLLKTDSIAPRFEIQAGRIDDSLQQVAELTVGTEIQIKSFWRNHRYYLIGGAVEEDFALVEVSSPMDKSVTAKLSVHEFDDVFDSSMYVPKPPSGPN